MLILLNNLAQSWLCFLPYCKTIAPKSRSTCLRKRFIININMWHILWHAHNETHNTTIKSSTNISFRPNRSITYMLMTSEHTYNSPTAICQLSMTFDGPFFLRAYWVFLREIMTVADYLPFWLQTAMKFH